MVVLDTVRTLLKYGDWADQQVLRCAISLSPAQLDRPFQMGVGSLRRTLLHIYNGEHVWLQRWKDQAVNRWPSDAEAVGITALSERLRQTWEERDAFLATLRDADMDRMLVYQDTTGGFFSAPLGHMLLEGCIHSTHHRAQAVNMLRHVGAEVPELDYIMWIRKPAPKGA